MIKQLPAGRVTFAVTDVVGSTRAFDEFGELYVAALRHLRDFLASAQAGRRRLTGTRPSVPPSVMRSRKVTET